MPADRAEMFAGSSSTIPSKVVSGGLEPRGSEVVTVRLPLVCLHLSFGYPRNDTSVSADELQLSVVR